MPFLGRAGVGRSIDHDYGSRAELKLLCFPLTLHWLVRRFDVTNGRNLVRPSVHKNLRRFLWPPTFIDFFEPRLYERSASLAFTLVLGFRVLPRSVSVQ